MHKVTIEEMLDQREWRAKKQRQWIEEHGFPIISFSLNIPGEIKDFLLARQVFDNAFQRLAAKLTEMGIHVIKSRSWHKRTGPFGLMAVNGDGQKIKTVAVRMEEEEKAGRLFDIDILGSGSHDYGGHDANVLDCGMPDTDAFDTVSRKIQRTDVGFSPRKCILCDKEAFICARSRAHPAEELFDQTIRLVKEAADPEPILRKAGEVIFDALLFEVGITPKPGLVDSQNSGAHEDMNFFTFVQSANSIHKYFYEFGAAGYTREHLSFPALFESIREIGIQAEKAMFKVTKGVNTHKGLIFSLGNVAVAFGHMMAKGIDPDAEGLCETVKQMTAGVVEKDLSGITLTNAKTKGEKLYAKYGVTGIRGEVSSGFETVRRIGLPVFRACIKDGMSINHAGVNTLISIMSELDDTNILSRHDRQTLDFVKKEASYAKAEGGMRTEKGQEAVVHMDEIFIRKNISPGGSADLLAVTIALFFLEKLANE